MGTERVVHLHLLSSAFYLQTPLEIRRRASYLARAKLRGRRAELRHTLRRAGNLRAIADL